MAEYHNTKSVYSLITNLCEQFIDNPDKLKKSRSECYEILLGKKCFQRKKHFKDLKNTSDPFCHMLAWQFTLSYNYGMWDYANELKKYTEHVREAYGNDRVAFNNILQFLLCLRNVPTENNNKLDLSSLPAIENNINFDQLFRLPNSLICESEKYCDNSFYIKSKLNSALKFSNVERMQCVCDHSASKISCRSRQIVEINQENVCQDPTNVCNENIWEMAARLKFSNRRNWENFGYSEPEQESRFLSELGDLSSLWVENLEFLYVTRQIAHDNVFRLKLKPKKDFIKDVKFLLVGMASDSFGYNEYGEFYLLPGISIEGITPNSLEVFCRDFIFSGSCYKALNEMCTPNPENGKYKYNGYIFKELCDSIQRYLQFYRTATMSVSDATNPLAFHQQSSTIRYQILILTKICKIGPYVESEEIPDGVALLNYLYLEVLTLTDSNVILVLYSILYSCCQVYISRYLTQWILEGTVNDPYGEFFIKPNSKYISTRGRTYWTRSYSIREDVLPDFLVDLRMDILNCGKNMNLLKMCYPTSKLCVYLMGKKPLILSCCITSSQLMLLKQNTTRYYLEVCQECGPKLCLTQIMRQVRERDPIFIGLIAKKRAATLSRLELERQQKMQVAHEKRQEELHMLKVQLEAALELRQTKIAMEIEREMKLAEELMATEKIREDLIEKETNSLIDYYTELSAAAEQRRVKAEENLKCLKSILLNADEVPQQKEENEPKVVDSDESLVSKTDTSNESFYSVEDVAHQAVIEKEEPDEQKHLHTSTFLDIINANTEDESYNEHTGVASKKPTKYNANIQQAIDNFELARKNKCKVMTEEMGISTEICNNRDRSKALPQLNTDKLTAAQRNKLKVLSSEFGIHVKTEEVSKGGGMKFPPSVAEINKMHVLGSDRCFFYEDKTLDNDNFLNKNITTNLNVDKSSTFIRKPHSFSLDIKLSGTLKDGDKPIPMSVDSTPLSELPQSTVTTPSTMFLSVDTNQFESVPTTADTQATDEGGFVFNHTSSHIKSPYYVSQFVPVSSVFSKRVTENEAAGVTTNCLRLFLYECISVPLQAHLELVNNELLKYFVTQIHYFEHLRSLRDYFFLRDGEFGRSITENLFEKLYDANFPIDIINCRTLQHLVFDALDISNSAANGNQACLSFKINKLPKCFDLGNPDVLECISLTYKLNWPLNILLPTDSIAKYDEVFKYLLKLNRVSWVLKKIFLELKILARETGKKEIYLMMSPQYRRLHQCRHVMLHFIQTLQNYIVGEVLQTSWNLFEKDLASVTNLDDIYFAHTAYIKQILFMCLLNQKSTILRNVIHKIFIVILKFYDYLRSRSWNCVDGAYIHPNFTKLNSIFKNFEEFVWYFFKVGRKVAKCGYQPHLIQLLDMLNLNSYYSDGKGIV